MNEFFRLRQLTLSLEEYYSKFVTLQRYAPKMTIEQQVTRFCQGLNEPINTRLEAMRPTTVQDALLRAKPLIREQLSMGSRGKFQQNQGPNDSRQQRGPQQQGAHVARAQNSSQLNVRCYECNELGHYRNKCPKLANRVAEVTGTDLRDQVGGRNLE